MAILVVPSVTAGAIIKPSETSSSEYKADNVVFNLGSLKVTQNLLLGAGVGFLIGALWKS